MAATTPPRTRGATRKDSYLDSLTGVTSRRGIRSGLAGDKSPSRRHTKVKPPQAEKNTSQSGEEGDEVDAEVEVEEMEMDGGSLQNSDDELAAWKGSAPSGWANASEKERGGGDDLEAEGEIETEDCEYTEADTGKGSGFKDTLSDDKRNVQLTELDGGRRRRQQQRQQQQQQRQQQRQQQHTHSYQATGRRPSAAKVATTGGRDRPPPLLLLLLAGLTLVTLAALAALAWSWSAGAGRGRGSPVPAGLPGDAPEPLHQAVFGERLEAARRRHPSQCDELWRRVNITLRRHLAALADGDPGTPSQPATLLLASGPRGLGAAEGLAAGLAAAYGDAAAAASDDGGVGGGRATVTLSGVELSGMSGDDAKLELDARLQSALGADDGAGAGAAVALVRLERLPPASTLMLYAYCDHETAKFKRALLIFTVLLDHDDRHDDRRGDGGRDDDDDDGGRGDGGEAGEGSCRALRDFSDRVYASLRRALVGPRLDLDKFAGLWSRVATVVLPVQPEGSP
ncbi:uncharacterized protein LOC144952594 [Lampetra fluviatilis]